MLAFPNCKINLGLHVLNKRADGFHDIETAFYPVGWCDALELIAEPGSAQPFSFAGSGEIITGSYTNNLVYKAWQLLNAEKKLPPVKVQLHKNVPMGAGLGGGSSDASKMLALLNEKFALGYSQSELAAFALSLGSDCPFFIHNTPMLAAGRGEKLSEIMVDLSGYYILISYPGIHVSTAEAYAGVKPEGRDKSIADIVNGTPASWKERLQNDFEKGVFEKHPPIKKLRDSMYDSGALYSAMSGSGSAVFGIFEKAPPVQLCSGKHYLQKPGPKIL